MKIGVLMSGGVDSSYTAYLLKSQKNEVAGFTLLLTAETCDRDDSSFVESARNVCEYIGIEHNIIDLRDEFKRIVEDYLIDEYLHGRTPNPCIVCNNKIKFDRALEEILTRGFNKVATGHYANIEKEHGTYKLFRGFDERKEQSYFLWTLSQEVLSTVLFPLGGFEKDTVQEWADDEGLPYEKRESQDVCFLKEGSVGEYIRSRVDIEGGDIVNSDGEIIGKHDGIVDFTVGSRRGLNLGGMEEPYYVIDIDPATNRIIVGTEEETRHSSIMISDVKTTHHPISELTGEYLVQIRYNSIPVIADIIPLEGDSVNIHFVDEVRAPAPGQSAVIYNENELIGGGIIDTILE